MGRRIYRHDDILGTRIISSVTAQQGFENTSYLVRSNADGFRCRHEFEPTRTPGKKRILLFGDSFTVGPGVAAEKRFGDLIEEALDDVEVYNFGLTGSGTDQQYLAYHHIGAKIEHDLVLLVPWVENIRRNPAEARTWNDRWSDNTLSDSLVFQPKPYFERKPDGSLELHNVPVPKPVPYHEVESIDDVNTGSEPPLAALRWQIKKRAPWLKDVLQGLTKVQPVPEYDDPDNDAWLLMRSIIEMWHGELEQPMLLCPIPMYQHIEGAASAKGYQARFAELDRPADGLTLHDVLPVMQQGSRSERRAMRFTKDIHFSESGHARFAEALLPAVRKALA